MARIAENSVILDGIMYKPGQEIPDLGNWICIKIEGGRHFYEGISQEVELLPTYVNHGSRSSFLYCFAINISWNKRRCHMM